MTTTPAGWYDDGHGALRWWDGAQWTEHVHTPVPDAAASAPAPQEQVVPAPQEQVVPAPPAAPAPQAPAAHDAAPELPWELQQRAPGQPVPGSPDGSSGYPHNSYPGFAGAPEGGVFTGSTDPKKSKLWILWVVLGVVVIGIIVLGIVLIPLLLHFFSAAAGAGGQAGGSDDEKAAVAVVQLYDESLDTSDCDKFTAATTADFREAIEIVDCDAFTNAAATFADQTDDYEITVDSIDSGSGGDILVSTSETYTSPYDENGEPTDSSTVYTDNYVYTLVATDGGWAIDGIDDSQ